VTLFCAKAILKVQKLILQHSSGDADKVNLKYTDSGLIKVILLSDKMLDYSALIFRLPNSLRS
jgi:hypothetical protein